VGPWRQGTAAGIHATLRPVSSSERDTASPM
jgi:hypothetical protein